MKKLSFLAIIVLVLSLQSVFIYSGAPPSSPPLVIQEVDGSPAIHGAQKIVVSNGKLTASGSGIATIDVTGSSFSATDITGATEDTTPATTSLAILSQAGTLIKSTLAEIATAIKGSYFGTLTNTKWCTTNGTLVACTENAPQPALGVLAGTLTNTYLCKYTAAGTLLSCDVDPATFQVAGSYAPASGIALTALANQAANTVNANATSGAAAPTAVAIAEQQVVGRLAGGNIKGLSAAELLALAAAAPAAGSTSVVNYGPTAIQSASCTANALTLTPTAGLGIVNISVTQTGDANCAITMAETSAVEGTVAIIKNVSDGAAETLTFTSSANVIRLIQGSPFAMAINETLILQYKNSEWLEIGRSSGTISVSLMSATPSTLPRVDGSAALSLSAAQVSGTIIRNSGQIVADVNHTLPVAAAGYNFIATVGTTLAATNYWRFTANTTPTPDDFMCLDGTCGKTYVSVDSPTMGDTLTCWTDQVSSTGMSVATALSAATATDDVKNTAATIDIAGQAYAVAATDGTAPGDDVIVAAKWGVVAFDVGVNGTIDAVEEAGQAADQHANEAAAIAAMEAQAPEAGHVRIGYVTASKSDGTFTFGTDALVTAGTTTANFYNTAAYTKPFNWICITGKGTWTTN